MSVLPASGEDKPGYSNVFGFCDHLSHHSYHVLPKPQPSPGLAYRLPRQDRDGPVLMAWASYLPAPASSLSRHAWALSMWTENCPQPGYEQPHCLGLPWPICWETPQLLLGAQSLTTTLVPATSLNSLLSDLPTPLSLGSTQQLRDPVTA
jgi:hypothetical protein